MPELPEIEHLRRTLEPRLVGRRIAHVEVHRADVIHAAASAGAAGGRAVSAAVRRKRLLQGSCIGALRRHGKQLAIIAAPGAPILIVQLGMTGQLLFVPGGRDLYRADHIHVRWRLEGPAPQDRLVFRDPRRFGRLTSVDSLEALEGLWRRRLGTDALHARVADLRARLARMARPIKAALLDQGVLAGIGNIYADEALHRARIHPLSRADRLAPSDLKRLAAAIRLTLRQAVNSGGTTLRDYVDSDGRRGRHPVDLLAYARSGLPCRRCRTPMEHLRIAQRTTTFCPRCQPANLSTLHPQRA